MASITKRMTQDGTVRWTMRVFVGRDQHGKRRFITRTFGRKKDADAEARRLEKMKDGGTLTITSKEPFGEYLGRWLATKATTVRARTVQDYRGIVQRYVLDPPRGAPLLAPIRLDRLTAAAFEALYTWLWEQGKAPRTVAYAHTVLSMALNDAVKKGILPANVAKLATKPARRIDGDSEAEGAPVRHLTQEEAARFLVAARDDRYSALWHVLLTGGLRPSEALALGWAHVDFEAGRVRVARSLVQQAGEWKLLPPKTASSRRSVPLPPFAMAELRTWKSTRARERLRAGPEWENHGVVFTNPFGRPLAWRYVSRANYPRIMAAAGLGAWGTNRFGKPKFRPSLTPYEATRHTCATLLLEAGEELKTVSERLGHKNISITADTYAHVTRKMEQRAAEKLEAMFGVPR